MKKILNLILGTLIVISVSCTGKNKPLAILGAFYEEIRMLEDSLEHKKTGTINGINYSYGKLAGKDVILAYTGIGKVNAAMTTALFINEFKPERVIFTGIAGGLNPGLQPTDIVVAEQCVHHDLVHISGNESQSYIVTNPLNGTDNPVFFDSDTLMIKILRKLSQDLKLIRYDTTYMPGIFFGTIATGDAFIASQVKKKELTDRFGADAVEMEGAAIAQVCFQFNVPFVIIRSISDNADENADFVLEKFLTVASENANLVVMRLVGDLP